VRNTADYKQNTAQKSYLTDNYVWATICYLDSPGDFPESLPEWAQHEIRPPNDQPLIFLDDLPNGTPWNSFAKIFLCSIFLFILGILLLCG
jgi:hypothetical protein